MDNTIEIIYQDHDLAVCRKAPGISVQTSRLGQQDMVSLLRNYFARKGEENTQVFVVHRLDQPVEGIMVFARNKQAAAELSRQSRERSMDKYYLALAEGEFEKTSGVLENYLLRDGKANTSSVVAAGTPGAKHARLRYVVEKVWKAGESLHFRDRPVQQPAGAGHACGTTQQALGYPDKAVSLVHVHLDTGRHHQIRVQMAYAGHPLLGDRKYNPGCGPGYFPVGLCAVRIAFLHPSTRQEMEFEVKPQGQAFSMIAGVQSNTPQQATGHDLACSFRSKGRGI